MKFDEKLELTRNSNLLVYSKIIELENEVRKMKKEDLYKPNYRIYKSPHFNNKSPYIYLTFVMIDETYIPSALNLANSLRVLKTEHKIVCLVQDKSYVNIFNGTQMNGISYESIENLLLVFDEVIGCDLHYVQKYEVSKEHFTNNEHYKNILYYSSKINILGLTQYKKILYIDASTLFFKNMDFIFSRNKSSFQEDQEWLKGEVGLRGTFFFYIPDSYCYHKALILNNNYHKYFKKYFFIRGVDEVIIYYSICPNWSDNLLDSEFGCNGNDKNFMNNNCGLYYFQKFKPFQKIEGKVSDYKKEIMNNNYEYWDHCVDNLLEKYPQLIQYFKHIREFRDIYF